MKETVKRKEGVLVLLSFHKSGDEPEMQRCVPACVLARGPRMASGVYVSCTTHLCHNRLENTCVVSAASSHRFPKGFEIAPSLSVFGGTKGDS